jgi:NADH-quinone oxidoreductase subunit H
MLFVLAMSSLMVFGIIIAGWASNSKYALLGALRSAAQMVSYEVAISLLILPVLLCANTLNFGELVIIQNITQWFIWPLLPCYIAFNISMLAETNRAPFDLPEAEAELVAGYNVEYAAFIFAMFFLGEYANMILMSTLVALLFLGGWGTHCSVFFLALKIVIVCIFFVLVRATLPRYRYDYLMTIGWTILLPISLAMIVICNLVINPVVL